MSKGFTRSVERGFDNLFLHVEKGWLALYLRRDEEHGPIQSCILSAHSREEMHRKMAELTSQMDSLTYELEMGAWDSDVLSCCGEGKTWRAPEERMMGEDPQEEETPITGGE